MDGERIWSIDVVGPDSGGIKEIVDHLTTLRSVSYVSALDPGDFLTIHLDAHTAAVLDRLLAGATSTSESAATIDTLRTMIRDWEEESARR